MWVPDADTDIGVKRLFVAVKVFGVRYFGGGFIVRVDLCRHRHSASEFHSVLQFVQ